MNQAKRFEDDEDDKLHEAMWKVESCGQAIDLLGPNMKFCPACFVEENDRGFIKHKHPDIYRNN